MRIRKKILGRGTSPVGRVSLIPCPTPLPVSACGFCPGAFGARPLRAPIYYPWIRYTVFTGRPTGN